MRLTLAVLLAGWLVHSVHVTTGLGGEVAATLVTPWLYWVLMIAASVLALARGVLVRAERAAWLLIGASMVAWSVSDVVADLYRLTTGEVWLPSSVGYFLSYAGEYAGIATLVRDRLRPLRVATGLDGAVGGLALASVVAALAYGPVLEATAGDPLTVILTLAFAACDLLLLVVVGVAIGLTGWRPTCSWALLAGALALSAVSDAAFAWQQAVGTYVLGGVLDATWPTSILLVAFAAWSRPGARTQTRSALTTLVLSTTFVALALVALIYSQFAEVPVVATVLAGGAVMAALVRAGLTQRDNHRLLTAAEHAAVTDRLTGLGNRRALLADLDGWFATATDHAPLTLGFFDLDGFKGYNDRFGHGAGDALLQRMGNRLRAAVAGTGSAYRLGGDEFCVLLQGAVDVTGPTVALTESGEGFAVFASAGAVVLPRDASTSAQALKLADERMYSAKRSRGGRGEVHDVLVRALTDRDPERAAALRRLGRVARAAGASLGLISAGLDELTRAVELHDVGTIAVPDRVLLHGTAPLDEVEQRMLANHPLVGERLLAVLPALRPVARLVRATHEHFDGTGGPDKLAGEQIPLAARLLAVAATYDELTAGRWRQPSLVPTAALAELDGLAGTRLDPQAVRAFIDAVHAARTDPVTEPLASSTS